MGEEFQGGVCGGTWWNRPTSLFSGGFSAPSVATLGDVAGFGWPISGRCNYGSVMGCEEITDSVIDDPIGFSSTVDQQKSVADTGCYTEGGGSGGGGVLMDPTLEMMGFGISTCSSATNWNQETLFCNAGKESNYNSILQEDVNSRLEYGQVMGMNFSSISGTNEPINQAYSNSSNNSGDSTVTCEGFPINFPTSSSPPNSSLSYPSNLIPSLFDSDPISQQQQQNQLQQQSSVLNSTIHSSNSYSLNSNELISSPWAMTDKPNNTLSGSISPPFDSLNNTHILNTPNNITMLNNIRASLLNSLQSRARSQQRFDNKSSTYSNLANSKAKSEEVKDSSKNNNEPTFKRQRIETPSPLPTFKVRKEKLGDRITALQQLVSPFGKTDTASVLHEAIEYIKFLHDQVNVLSTPYLKNGTPTQQQQVNENSNGNEEMKQDLRSKGLCLVPISSTFPLAHETPVDFWTPTFGATF